MSIPAVLHKATTIDGLMGMHDTVALGTGYDILGPPKMQAFRNIPTGRIIARVSVPVCRTGERPEPGVETWLPLELLTVAPVYLPMLLMNLIDGIRPRGVM